MLRALLFTAALAVCSSAPLAGQCTVFRGGCPSPNSNAPVQVACNGEPNICCPGFQVIGRGFDPVAVATFCSFVDCRTRIPLPSPPACSVGCVLYLTEITSLQVYPIGGALTLGLGVPCIPSLVGASLCVQFAEIVQDRTGAFCISLSDALSITVGSRGSC